MNTNNLRLPHFFLFPDLFYAHLEAKKILQTIKNGNKEFAVDTIEQIAKHYLILFEILEFLHEYTPDFLVINKINDINSDIVCFANKEFSQTFGFKENPEGQDILKLLPNKAKNIFNNFVIEEINKAKQIYQSNHLTTNIAVKSKNLEIPINKKHQDLSQYLYELHIRLVGAIDTDNIFNGYSIIIGRDITDEAIKQEIAKSFTNIPDILYEKFRHEAFRRKILGATPQTITMKNVLVLSGNSDISASAKMRLEAEKIDAINKNNDQVIALNQKIESINKFLINIWEKAKHDFNNIHPSVFVLEETDGISYHICLIESEKHDTESSFVKLREVELLTMANIAQQSALNNFPLKHLILAHKQKVDFYFEEKFTSRFEISTRHVSLFIKKNRLEKACEKNSKNRIVAEKTVCVAVDNDEDFEFYHNLFSKHVNNGIFTEIYVGEVEILSGLENIRFIRGQVKI